MIKRAGLLMLVLCSLIISLFGCETTKGVAIGVGATAIGAAKDTYNTYDFVCDTDTWMRRNLW